MKSITNFIFEKLKISSRNKISNPDDPTTWQVGEIIHCAFNYSARIPYFFEITKRTNKGLVAKELKTKLVSGSYNSPAGYEVMPILGEYESDKEVKGRINKWGQMVIDKKTCFLWDGKTPETGYCD